MNEDKRLEKCLQYFDGDKLAANTFLKKYALDSEETPDDMHRRIAKEYVRIEKKFGGKNTLSENEIYDLFSHFKYVIPGGSVMNGLGNSSYIGSLSNCFVAGQPEDSYSSIMKYREIQVQMMKRRGGVGIDLSKLRPEGAKVNNAAKTSTGPVSFINCFSELTKEVALNGRRGALMISMSVNHPDIDKFISCKQDLTKNTGANISVKFTDEFMKAVENDTDYIQTWPINTVINNFNADDMEYNKLYYVESQNCYAKRVKASEIWKQFVHCAWNTAEPGIMYEDRHINYSPDGVYDQYRGVTSNPCVTGDAMIAVADGRGYVSIKELADNGADVPVYCLDNDGKLTISLMRNPRLTGKNKQIYKITLENGHEIKCTDNHKFLLNEKGYVEAKNIKVGDSMFLMKDIEKSKINENLSEYDYKPFTKNGIVYVHKKCEECGKDFIVEYNKREISFCSKECSDKYINKPKIINKNFCDYIKVFSVELCENEDVYNGTVDNYHNFFVGKFEEFDENGNRKILSINNLNCGEIFMGSLDSCRLMHINLSSFVTENGKFDYKLLKEVAYKNSRLCDDLVELELEHIQDIIQHVKKHYTDDNRTELELWENVYKTGKSSRRAGCGTTGLADAIALMGIKLGSEESFTVIDKIFRTKMKGEIEAQFDLAKERGTFKGYSFDKEFEYKKSCFKSDIYDIKGKNDFFDNILKEIWFKNGEYIKEWKKYGRRNVSWSTMAPVGTGAIMAQGTSGIEPLFMPYYKRRKKCMTKDDRVDFIDNTGEKFSEYFIIHYPLKKWIEKKFNVTIDDSTTEEQISEWYKKSPWYGCTASDLTPEQHVRLQSIVQKYTTHSISKTCNLPSNTTEEKISKLYLLGWKEGCKGLTVYRDGCRDGILVKTNDNKDCKCNGTLTHNAPKRPKSLQCDIKRFRNGGDKWIACVGLYQGQPYEIFTGLADRLSIPDEITTCEIIKNKYTKTEINTETGNEETVNASRYDIVYVDENGDKQEYKDVGNIFRTEFYSVSKMTSALLRHGMPVEYVISTIKSLDFKNDTINSWKSGVIRTLKGYIKEGEVNGEVCPECGSKLVRENGCVHCSNPECSYSKCS